MKGKPSVIAACHFHFRLLQSLRIYELLLLPLLHIFELNGAQIDEDKCVVDLLPTELRKIF
jgi:hypothetical protein